jgi:hypothetical protein
MIGGPDGLSRPAILAHNNPFLVSTRETIERYVKAVQQHDYNEVIVCFAENAIVVHPIFGTKPAPEFFKSLFTNTGSDHITVKTVFDAADDPHTADVLFYDEWRTADGTEFNNDIVLVFRFDDAALVRKLTVIFDTFPVRGKL